MLLEYDRSYIHIFIGYFAVFLTSMAFGAFGYASSTVLFAAITLPTLIAFLLVSQLRSGIALDSWWVAKYRRGTWQYTCLIVWNSFGLVLMIGISAASLGLRWFD